MGHTDSDPDPLNVAPGGYIAFRDDGAILAVNDPLLRLLGYERETLLGRHVEDILGVAGKIFLQTHLFPLVRLHGLAEEIYVELRTRDGERIPVLLNARRDGAEGAGVTRCVMIRVRERKKYEDELLRARQAADDARAEAMAANEAKSHYLRSVSHEIRTPINALMGYADLLELAAGKPMGEQQLAYVDRVRQAARHLLTLVNDILDLAKIESEAMAVERRPQSIAATADAALALVEPLADQQGVHLLLDDETDMTFMGDQERAVQILVNLLSNAVKFTASGGQVRLRWEGGEGGAGGMAAGVRNGRWLRVDVEDTGIGIPADRLEDVFLPFHQVIEGSGDRRGGTGLGLTISRELARLMGGDIDVRSEPGIGSTFSLWLPGAG